MNKEQQIEKDRLIQIEEIDELIREKFHGQVAYRMDISKYGGFNGYTPLCTYDISKALYNAGYRKTFTSDLASDTQKAYKEGYIKGIEERLKAQLSEFEKPITQFVKDRNAQAVKEFAEKLKKQIANTMYCRDGYVDYDDTMDVIDELLKEYEK